MKSIKISVNAAQAAVDAINHRLGTHEEALKVIKGEVEWDDDEELESDEGSEVQNLISQYNKNPNDLQEVIDNLKAARSALCAA